MNMKRHKILVVDDERAIASLHAAVLASQGYETATAYSGEEAVQAAHLFQPDCIVSDVMMEPMNGVEAAIEIVRFLPDCRVLFISGYAGYGGQLRKALAGGFNFEVLDKPVRPREMLARVSEVLADSVGSNRKPAVSQHPA